MKASFGYALQMAGLFVVAAGLLIGLTRGTIWTELLLMLVGAGLFVGGRALAGRGD